MSVALETDIFLELMIQEAFDEEKQCEHSRHKKTDNGIIHSGVAKWYASYHCPNCGDTKGIMALCDPWKRFAMSGKKLQCPACGESAEGEHFYRDGWTAID